MSLPKQVQKIKGFIGFYEHNLLTGVHILLLLGVGIGSYLLGAENALGDQKQGVSVFSPVLEVADAKSPILEVQTLSQAKGEVTRSAGSFIGSQNGTKYHRLDCAGAKTIKEENRIFFATEEEAKRAGYTPAGNCPGLQ